MPRRNSTIICASSRISSSSVRWAVSAMSVALIRLRVGWPNLNPPASTGGGNNDSITWLSSAKIPLSGMTVLHPASKIVAFDLAATCLGIHSGVAWRKYRRWDSGYRFRDADSVISWREADDRGKVIVARAVARANRSFLTSSSKLGVSSGERVPDSEDIKVDAT